MNVPLVLYSVVLTATIVAAGGAEAQTRSTRDTATAYGARLNSRGLPANENPKRVNSRIDNRINSRLALRIERYRPDNTDNPTAAFMTQQDDKSRSTPDITPPPQADEQ